MSAALEGRWTGTLDAGGGQAALTERGGDVSIDVPAAGGSWKGALSGDSMTGMRTQAGSSLPLTFTRVN